jgi:lysophospholipase L1-like esterase
LWKIILSLGDSLTRGFQIHPKYRYPIYTPYTDILQARLLSSGKNVAVLNKGIDGDTTSGMLERYSRSVAPEEPDFVIIWAGINDLYAGLSIEQIHNNIKELFERTTGILSIPISCSLTPVLNSKQINRKIKQLNYLIKGSCSDLEIIFIDLYNETSDNSGNLLPEYSSDGVHLSQIGYSLVGEVIYNSIINTVI